MILIVVVRRAVCETCTGSFDLYPDEDPPKECKLCGSRDWEYGPLKLDTVKVQEGRTTGKRKLNPGVKARNRQVRGKKQWRKFHDKEGKPL